MEVWKVKMKWMKGNGSEKSKKEVRERRRKCEK